MLLFDLTFSPNATAILNNLLEHLKQFSILSKKKLCTLFNGQNNLHSDFNCAFAEFVTQSYNKSIISSLTAHGLAAKCITKVQFGFYLFLHVKFSRLSQKNTYFKVLHSLHLRMCGTSNSGINFLHKLDVWYVVFVILNHN